MASAAILCAAACQKTTSDNTAVLSMNTRFMRNEPITVKVSGMSAGTQMTVKFSNGETVSGDASEGITYKIGTKSKTGKGYTDYSAEVTAGSRTFNRDFRVYDLLAISALMDSLRADSKLVLNMTHRANTSDLSIPENSIAALNACIACGVDAVETDTQLTSDGVIVISHDQTINRCTNGTGDITQMTYAEIQKYYLKDRNGKLTAMKIPTLEEYLLAGRGLIYYDLDYSPRSAGTAEVMSVVQKLGMMEQVWLYCNTVDKIKEVRTMNPKAEVYCWVTNAKELVSGPGKYFIQANYDPVQGGSTSGSSVASAEALGAFTSIMTIDNVSNTTIEDKHLDELFTMFPNVRMIMNNVGDVMETKLHKRGRK